MSATVTGEKPTVPFFKKKKARSTVISTRKRSASPGDAGPSTEVILPSKKAAASLLSAGSKRKISQRDREETNFDEEEKDGPGVNWGSGGNSSHIDAALEILAGDEAEEVLAAKRRRNNPEDADDGGVDDGKYHGQSAYKSHLQKSKDIPKAMRVGPQRSSGSTIRTVTIVDYQPDVCKDYKETGYCGFGDTCKFLHDRGTYLAGWQLDNVAGSAGSTTAQRQNPNAGNSDLESSDEEDIPFACLICRKHYTDPIVTRCGHYFCSACAIKRFAKTPKCRACGAPTGGMFNRADKIIEKMNKKRKDAESGSDDDNEGGEGGVEIEGLANESD